MANSFLDFSKKYAVAGSSKLHATTAGHIYNIVVVDNVLENGAIVGRGDYVESNCYKQAAAPTSFAGKIIEQAANGNYYVEVVTPADAVLVLQVPTTPYNYTSQMVDESQFFNVKDDIVRGYALIKGDIFELSAEGFKVAPTSASIGKAVSVDATTKKLLIAA